MLLFLFPKPSPNPVQNKWKNKTHVSFKNNPQNPQNFRIFSFENNSPHSHTLAHTYTLFHPLSFLYPPPTPLVRTRSNKKNRKKNNKTPLDCTSIRGRCRRCRCRRRPTTTAAAIRRRRRRSRLSRGSLASRGRQKAFGRKRYDTNGTCVTFSSLFFAIPFLFSFFSFCLLKFPFVFDCL